MFDIGDQLSYDLDNYGWAETDEARRKALLTWMQHITSAIVVLHKDRNDAASELESRLIDKGILDDLRP